MREMDEERVKTIIATARKVHGPAPGLAGPSRLESLADERVAAKLLTSALEKVGVDVAALEKALRQDTPHSVPRPDASAVARHAAMKTSITKNMRALSGLRRPSALLAFDPPSVELIQPLFTWSLPTGILVASGLDADDNWIQAHLQTNGDGGSYVSFVCVWNNAKDYPVAVDLATSVGFLGYCSVKTFGGLMPGVRVSNGHVSAHMAIYRGDSPDVLITTPVHVLDLHANSYWGGASTVSPLDAIVDVSNASLYVASGESVAVEVFASFTYTNLHGQSMFEFAEPDYRIWMPGLMITAWPFLVV
jgi:hypothetical protein